MNLVSFVGSEPVVSTTVIAEQTGNEHKSVLQIVEKYKAQLEKFGGVAFEMEPFATNGGEQERRITRLNEDQATLLITFLRNNDRVVRFKVALVSAFSQIKKQQLQPQLPANYIEALESLVISEKEKALALEQLQEQAPKIAVYEQLADRKEDINTSTLAKMLGTSAIKLNQWLKLKGYKWMGKDLPKAGYESWFNLVCGTNNERGYTQCLITAKGQLEIAKRWAKDFKGNNNE